MGYGDPHAYAWRQQGRLSGKQAAEHVHVQAACACARYGFGARAWYYDAEAIIPRCVALLSGNLPHWGFE